MGKVVTSLSQKKSGAYTTPIPFGANSENVQMKNKKNLEEEFQRVDNNFPIIAKDNGNNEPSGVEDVNN